MKLRILVLAGAAALVLAACGSGPVKRVSPPTATIQELSVQPDGSWNLLMRVQNFSNVPMTFSFMNAALEINGVEAGLIDTSLDLDVPGESADVLTLNMIPAPGTRIADAELAYRLHGNIESSDPSGKFNFERKSHLSPAPGLPGTWR